MRRRRRRRWPPGPSSGTLTSSCAPSARRRRIASLRRKPSPSRSRHPVTVTVAVLRRGMTGRRGTRRRQCGAFDCAPRMLLRGRGRASAPMSSRGVVFSTGCGCWRAATRMPPAITQAATMSVAFGPMRAREAHRAFARERVSPRASVSSRASVVLLVENVRRRLRAKGVPREFPAFRAGFRPGAQASSVIARRLFVMQRDHRIDA